MNRIAINMLGQCVAFLSWLTEQSWEGKHNGIQQALYSARGHIYFALQQLGIDV